MPGRDAKKRPLADVTDEDNSPRHKPKTAKRTSDGDQPPSFAQSNLATTPTSGTSKPTKASRAKVEPPPNPVVEPTEAAPLLPQSLDHLEKTHNVQPMHIASGSTINGKVTQLLKHLSPSPTRSSSEKQEPTIIALRSDASAASKLISIAEIAKRESEKLGQTLWQYNSLGERVKKVVPKPSKETKTQTGTIGNVLGATGTAGAFTATWHWPDCRCCEHEGDKETEDAGGAAELDVEEEDADEAFQTMKTELGEEEQRTKIRAVPVLTIYMSNTRVKEMALLYGEQTSG